MKSVLSVAACLLAFCLIGCGGSTAKPVSAAAKPVADYKTSLNKLCGDILTGLVDVEAETNADRVMDRDKQIKSDFVNTPKVPTTNDNSDVINELTEKCVASFGLYCEFTATAIKREKNDGPDSAKTERSDCKAIKAVVTKDLDKLLSMLGDKS